MITRRSFIVGAGALVAAPAFGSSKWPAKPIRIVVPFPPGGPTDLIVRLFSEPLASALGQPVVVENRSGASGNIGAQHVADAEPDGYTLVHNTVGIQAINPLMYPDSRLNPQNDFIGIATTTAIPSVLVVNPKSLPVTSLQELIETGKKNPDKLNMATFGVGTSAHVYGSLLQKQGEFNAVEVPYRGSGLALTALLGDQVDFLFSNITTCISHIQAGTLRALAVAAPARLAELPDVPTMSEAGYPGIDLKFWMALYAPAKTPKPIVDTLRKTLYQLMTDPKYAATLREKGAAAMPIAPAELDQFLKTDTERWARAAREIGIKAQT